eukprot:GHVN01048931.1.p2 GENE.GHVN01048931.1~~GHVN01048931.1.p2  ORF type:complete len:101 (-),score=28.24 GHVN01048931.1:417-674(-)
MTTPPHLTSLAHVVLHTTNLLSARSCYLGILYPLLLISSHPTSMTTSLAHDVLHTTNLLSARCCYLGILYPRLLISSHRTPITPS